MITESEKKLNVFLKPIDGFHMADYDFVFDVFVFSNRVVRKTKKDAIKVDDDNYMMTLTDDDIKIIGKGRINVLVTAYIPDADFVDGVRTERVLLLCK